MKLSFSRPFGLLLPLVLVLGLAFLASCKKDKAKAPTGNMMFYTFMNNSKFDAIKIYVDGKAAGEITLTHIEKPQCGTASSINVLNVPLSPGKHSWYAKQIKDGKEVDEWDEREDNVKENECTYMKLTE
ncbi:MAG: hypothetical protein ACTHMC_23120 [Pseudobacter sp.]|uniref:hypothetical protein n=1 Tax=Pseudobacter sp. TaxID=2045420 RepID=UPI003F824006